MSSLGGYARALREQEDGMPYDTTTILGARGGSPLAALAAF